MRCFHEAGLAKLLERAGGGIADKGYQGTPVTTPIKKQPGVELADADRESSRQLAKIRIAVEWAIAHLKNWRILATRYRSDLARTTPISRPRRPAQAQRGTRRAPPDL